MEKLDSLCVFGVFDHLCRPSESHKHGCMSASQRGGWQMSQPQIMIVLISHLTHIFICVLLLTFCRCDMKLWWKGHAVSCINAFEAQQLLLEIMQIHEACRSLTMTFWQYKNHDNSNVLPEACFLKHYSKCAVEPSRMAVKSHSFDWFTVGFFSAGFKWENT